MKSRIQLLDCTLRDGCYVVDGNFGRKAIGGIIKRLQDAHVEIIECGWLKNAPHEKGSAYYHIPSDIESYLISEKKPGMTYVAMIDYNRYDLKYLPEYNEKFIDAIRVVFPKGKEDEGLSLAEVIRKKGYQVYIQVANTLGYTDQELLDLIEKVNVISPEGISIVDTFGAMYPSDLRHIVALFNCNLEKNIKLGLHSHNNLQLSFANAMEFVEMLVEQERDIFIDASLCGMGRGAGNACTELVASFLNKKHGKFYDMDIILDTIDMYMNQYMKKYEWGYSIPYYISGTYCAHVNNVAYLLKTHKTQAKDMKNIIERLEPSARVMYNYDNLEAVYLDYQSKEVKDEVVISELKKALSGKNIVLIVPGSSAAANVVEIKRVISEKKAVVIGVNAAIEAYEYDYLFFGNAARYNYALEQGLIKSGIKIIVTSNVKQEAEKEYIVNYNSLIMQKGKLFDASIIMVIKLMSMIGIERVDIAGWDGYDKEKANYFDPNMEFDISEDAVMQLNQEMKRMLADYRIKNTMEIHFITKSQFDIM